VVRWFAWILVLAVWTALLVMPVPPPQELPLGELIEPRKFLIAKSIHVAGYAFLAATSVLLPMPRLGRCLVPALLILHGAATEAIQGQLPYRDGNLRDAALNALGVVLGVLITWKWRGQWTVAATQESPAPPPPAAPPR
jgi:VanZ family protein